MGKGKEFFLLESNVSGSNHPKEALSGGVISFRQLGSNEVKEYNIFNRRVTL